jgi:hypothetical protein
MLIRSGSMKKQGQSWKIRGSLRLRYLIMGAVVMSVTLGLVTLFLFMFRSEDTIADNCKLSYIIEWRESLTYRITGGELVDQEWVVSNGRFTAYSPVLNVDGQPGSSDRVVEISATFGHSGNLGIEDTAYVNVLVNGSVNQKFIVTGPEGDAPVFFTEQVCIPVEGNYQLEITLENDSDDEFWKISNGNIRTCMMPPAQAPVSLKEFHGSFRSEMVSLQWDALVLNDEGLFTVDASPDGVTFRQIGVLPVGHAGSDNTAYSFNDTSPYNGINYYRLKITDGEGYTTTLKTIPVNAIFAETLTPDSILFLPKSSDGSLAILVESPTDRKGVLQLLNSEGLVIHSQVFHLGAGVNKVSIRPERMSARESHLLQILGQEGELICGSPVPENRAHITASLN